MRTELTEVSLDTLGGGVVPELFAHELENVLANIDDPNTSPEAVRQLTIVVTIKPSEQDEVKRNAPVERMAAEAVQVAAMAVRFLMDICQVGAKT